MTREIVPAFRNVDGLRIPPHNTSSREDGEASLHEAHRLPPARKSSRTVERKAAAGEAGAWLNCLSIETVHDELRNIRMPNDETEATLLSQLQNPDLNAADVVREALEYVAEEVEGHALVIAYIWRYVQEHKLWQTCQNPEFRTEGAFLQSLRSRQIVQICIASATSTDLFKRNKLKNIADRWGAEWYSQVLESRLFTHSSQDKLPKDWLEIIAAISNQVDLEHSLELLQEIVRERKKILSYRVDVNNPHITRPDLVKAYDTVVHPPGTTQPESENWAFVKTPNGELSLRLFEPKQEETAPSSTGRKRRYNTGTAPKKKNQAPKKKAKVAGDEQIGSLLEEDATAGRIITPDESDGEPIGPRDHGTGDQNHSDPLHATSPQQVEATAGQNNVNTTSVTASQIDGICGECAGPCSVCQVPSEYDKTKAEELLQSAHQAQSLEAKAQNSTARKWISYIRFAVPTYELLGEEGDVCILTSESFEGQIRNGQVPRKPLIIQEHFIDRSEWSPARYADTLESVYQDLTVDVRWHRQSEPRAEEVSRMAKLCREYDPILPKDPPNMLSLPDLTGAPTPRFLRLDRYRLLDLVVERCKAEQGRLGKQTEATPFDIAGSRRFNILGWPGAFSGAHIDSSGATWVRNMFGYKLWMFVPEAALEESDKDQIAIDSDNWDPGHKARAVVLGPGDVFVMRSGLVHAVYTLGDHEPCLMTGGFFLDNQDLIHTLDTFYWIGKCQQATNEPLPYQMAAVIDSLEIIAKAKYVANSDDFARCIDRVRSLGCTCEHCDEDHDCSCSREGRRCTPFCVGHGYSATMRQCMIEQRVMEPHGEDSDEEYTDSTDRVAAPTKRRDKSGPRRAMALRGVAKKTKKRA